MFLCQPSPSSLHCIFVRNYLPWTTNFTHDDSAGREGKSKCDIQSVKRPHDAGKNIGNYIRRKWGSKMLTNLCHLWTIYPFICFCSLHLNWGDTKMKTSFDKGLCLKLRIYRNFVSKICTSNNLTWPMLCVYCYNIFISQFDKLLICLSSP